MKNTKKKVLTILLVLALLFTFVLPSIVTADDLDIKIDPLGQDSPLRKTAASILGIVQFIGIAVAVVMLIVYGIRYFTAAPEKQGDLKKAVWGYLIGAVCIFGAVAILQFVKNTFEKNVVTSI